MMTNKVSWPATISLVNPDGDLLLLRVVTVLPLIRYRSLLLINRNEWSYGSSVILNDIRDFIGFNQRSGISGKFINPFCVSYQNICAVVTDLFAFSKTSCYRTEGVK
jgi:hypothetical protein